MQTIQIHSRVGDDGVLTLRVPLGAAEANSDVVVTIQRPNGRAKAGNDEQMPWPEFVRRTYGSCADLGLQRPDQGDFESREPME